MNLGELFKALRQRKIVQTIVVYVGGSWGVLQALSLFQSTYAWPRTVIDVSLLVLGCGLAAAATIAWFHGERGHQRVTRLEILILVPLLALAVVGSWGLVVRDSRRQPDPVAPEQPTLVVLPFVNSTRDTSLVWLQKGMVEMLTTDLAQVPQLHVVSGQRVFDLLRQQGAAQAAIVSDQAANGVARQAGAGYLVRGAVFRSGPSYRLDAELVRTSDETVAASAQAVGQDIFPLVDSLAARLAGRLVSAPAAVTGARLPLARLATPNVDAFRAYHEGLQAEREGRDSDAVGQYRLAVAQDSTFSQALLRLGRLELAAGNYAGARQHLDQAQAALGRAPERDRRFAGALLATMTRDLRGATKALEQLTRRYPDDKVGWLWLARAYAADPARGAERERALRQALRLDPAYAPAARELAFEFVRRGDVGRADSFALRYVRLLPRDPEALNTRGEILEAARRYPEARAAYLTALRLRPDFADALAHLVRLGARSGQLDQATADLAPYLRSGDAALRVRALLLSSDLLLWRGRVDAALAAAEQARRESASLEPHGRDAALQATVALWQLLGDRQRVVQTLEPKIGGPGRRFLLQYAVALGELGRRTQLSELAERERAGGGGPPPPSGATGPAGLAGPPGVSAPPGPSERVAPPGPGGPRPVWLPDQPGRAGRPFPDAPDWPEWLRGSGLADVLAAYVDYYRGDWSGAVRRFRAARAARVARPDAGEDADPREVLSLINAGRAAEALPLVQPFDTAGFGSAIRRHVNLYLQARVYEATGRSEAAVRDYRLLLQDWGSSIARFPDYRDAPARLRRLTP